MVQFYAAIIDDDIDLKTLQSRINTVFNFEYSLHGIDMIEPEDNFTKYMNDIIEKDIEISFKCHKPLSSNEEDTYRKFKSLFLRQLDKISDSKVHE